MNELSSRSRVLKALDHQETDRIPLAMVCGGINPPAMQALDEYLRRWRDIDAQAYIDSFLDVREVWVTGDFNQATDMWGVRRKEVSYGEGSYSEISHYPLREKETLAEIRQYDFPQVKDMPVEEMVDEILHIRKTKDTALVLANANLFETSWYMRGFEQSFLDMMLQPDLIHFIMETVTSFFTDYFYEILKRCKGEIDLVFTADDIGQQDGLLLSLDMWEEFIKPYHVRINEMIHNMGAKVIYHTDGAVSKAVPGLVDMGIDVLQALQFSAANMDPQHLKENYGDELCFEGGMCVQKVLPFGTVEEVREETRKLIAILGKNGGYLCGPSHFIQAGTPPENIVTFFDEAQKFYPDG
ncbi:uroporphyrinogen decarboxylase family protein [Bacteroidota bacterium]